MTPQALIVTTLAVYFIAFSLARLDGPFDAFAWVRGHVDPYQRTWLGRGLQCPICLSFWAGLVVTLVIGASWLEWLGMCGAIVLLNKWVMSK